MEPQLRKSKGNKKQRVIKKEVTKGESEYEEHDASRYGSQTTDNVGVANTRE